MSPLSLWVFAAQIPTYPLPVGGCPTKSATFFPFTKKAAFVPQICTRYEVKRINHQEVYSLNRASTNWAESYFSRLRRGEMGHHHHIAGPYLLRYAQEAGWREDNRRVANGEQVNRVAKLALDRKPSVDFSGYWQRHTNPDGQR